MGEQDLTERTIEGCPDVFADLMNALMFGGRQVITETDLEDATAFSQFKMTGGEMRGQERDVAKLCRSSSLIHIAMIGIENQTKVDSTMPLRVISYDGASYKTQLIEKREPYPVMTLVLYFGTDGRWHRPRSLYDCFRVPEEMRPFVNDYRLNVIELAYLSDEEISRFKSDFQVIARMLRDKRLGRDFTTETYAPRHLPETLDLVSAIAGDPAVKAVRAALPAGMKEGAIKMCDVWNAIKSEERNLGIALGEARGIAMGEARGIALGEARGRETSLALLRELAAEGRQGDIMRAISDEGYFRDLMREKHGDSAVW